MVNSKKSHKPSRVKEEKTEGKQLDKEATEVEDEAEWEKKNSVERIPSHRTVCPELQNRFSSCEL